MIQIFLTPEPYFARLVGEDSSLTLILSLPLQKCSHFQVVLFIQYEHIPETYYQANKDLIGYTSMV